MGRRRSNIIIDRPKEDTFSLDKVTTKVKTTSVYQGVFDGFHEFAVVQLSGFKRRQPTEINVFSHLIHGAKPHDVMIFEAPKDSKWCGHCGDWVNKNGFSPKKDAFDGLHPVCKTCRNELERRRYWTGKLAA